MNTLVSVRIDERKIDKLNAIAQLHNRSKSFVINEAIDSYLALMDWQVKHIKKGVEQADKGEFASDKEVKAAFGRWKK